MAAPEWNHSVTYFTAFEMCDNVTLKHVLVLLLMEDIMLLLVISAK